MRIKCVGCIIDKSGPFADFHVVDIPVVDVEADGGADLMESLDTGGSRVDGEHIVFLVEDDLEYVRMSADEDVRQVGIDKGERLEIIASGIASYVHISTFLPSHSKNCVYGTLERTGVPSQLP